MRLDRGSFIFTPHNGQMPPWETALGQSSDTGCELPPYFFKTAGYRNILEGMIFNSVPLKEVSCVLGKGKNIVNAVDSYLNPEYQEIQMASKFDKIIVHYKDEKKAFDDIPIILLLTKIQDENKSHYGRRSLKYSPHATYGDSIKNQISFERIQKNFTSRLMCYGLFVEHLDTLHMYCIGADESNYDYEKLELPDGYRQNVIYPIVDDVLFQGLHGKKLEKKFAELLIEERKIHDSVGIDYFGFKYSELLDKYEISNVNILKLAGLSEKYATEIGKGKKLYRIVKDDSEGLNEKKATMMSFKMSSQKEPSNSIDDNHCVFNPSQTIFYGVPGCGKSNKIREQLKNVPEKNKVRVVFHPEYTNAEFIGQILPVTNGGIRYEFTPGPFTQIIKRAYLNPNEHFYLVIEEINRGNAAAIFGDTFQLLDRLKAGETDSLGNDPANAAVNTFTEGWSQYFVQNDDVNAYIRGTENSIQIGNIRFDSNTAIRLPPNLSILATMNTSDQNVFTLDNAFQRRFDMELVRNEFDLTQPAVNAQYNAEIDDTGIKWGQFWGWINAKITATLKGLSSTEDKRLGVWFVSNVGGIIDDKVFAEKVLKFLWDDVFKFKRPQIFADGIDTLEKLINSFEKPSEGKERFDVFKDKANLVAFVASPTL